MLIRSTAHPSYCPFAILLIRPTATSDLRQLFIFVLLEGQVRLRQFLGRALRLGRARGPGAAARSRSSSCKTTCQQVGWAVGRMGVGPKIHHQRFRVAMVSLPRCPGTRLGWAVILAHAGPTQTSQPNLLKQFDSGIDGLSNFQHRGVP